MTSPSESTEQPGLEGNLYGITVLPENMGQWVDEIYKRKVPIAEAKEVAEYLLAQEYSRGATKELDWVLAATNNPEDPCYAPKIAREVADRLAELEKGQEETKLKEPSNE